VRPFEEVEEWPSAEYASAGDWFAGRQREFDAGSFGKLGLATFVLLRNRWRMRRAR
jgi:hypothetical protein